MPYDPLPPNEPYPGLARPPEEGAGKTKASALTLFGAILTILRQISTERERADTTNNGLDHNGLAAREAWQILLASNFYDNLVRLVCKVPGCAVGRRQLDNGAKWPLMGPK